MGQSMCMSCLKAPGLEGSEVKLDWQEENDLDINVRELSKKLDGVVSRFLDLFEDSSNFEVIVKKPECEVLSREIESGYVIKIRFPIPFEPEVFLDFVSRVENRPNWDSNVQTSELILDKDSVKIIRTVYKGFLIIKPRESLLASKRVTIRGNQLDVNTSVYTDKIPTASDNVRVDVKLGGYHFQRIPEDNNGNICLVTGISEADFGFTPQLAKVARSFTTTAMPKFTRNLIKAIKNDISKNES